MAVNPGKYAEAIDASVVEVGNNEDPEQGGYNENIIRSTSNCRLLIILSITRISILILQQTHTMAASIISIELRIAKPD